MSKKSYTQRELEEAHNTNLVDFLRRMGETLKREGSNYKWIHNNEAISVKGNVWYNHYTGDSGEATQFVQKYWGVSYVDAVGILLNGTICSTEEDDKPFYLPERHVNMRRVYSYLVEQRGIVTEVVDVFADSNLIYEESKRHNVVFVGLDANGKAKHAHMRGTYPGSTFKMTVAKSDPDYSFHWIGPSDELFVFEAPIDMLSYITLNEKNWAQDSYVAACSVSDKVLLKCLEDYPHIKMVHLCLDNDTAGKEAISRMLEALDVMGIDSDVLIPEHKDWNEDLLFLREETDE